MWHWTRRQDCRTKSTLRKVETRFSLRIYICVGCVISCVFIYIWLMGTRIFFSLFLLTFVFVDLFLSSFIEARVRGASELYKGSKVLLPTQLLSHHLPGVPCRCCDSFCLLVDRIIFSREKKWIAAMQNMQCLKVLQGVWSIEHLHADKVLPSLVFDIGISFFCFTSIKRCSAFLFVNITGTTSASNY